jgi:hypothetical protein
MPILGILASSRLVSTNSYESISTVTVGSGGQSTISFTSIPATYKHLQIRLISRSVAGSADALRLSINGATGVYRNHYLEGDGSTAVAGTDSISGGINIYGIFSSTANIFGAGIIDILDYADTNKYKTTRSLTGIDKNGSGFVDFDSGLYMQTTAISSITLTYAAGNTFAQYSSFALYGIKG